MDKKMIGKLHQNQAYQEVAKYLENLSDHTEWLYELALAADTYRHAKKESEEIQNKYRAIAESGSLLLLKIENNNPKYLSLRGLVFHHSGDFNTALDFYEKAHELEPDNLTYKNDVANIYKALERFDDAEKMYLELLYTEIRTGALYNLAMLHLSGGNLTEAKRYAELYKDESDDSKLASSSGHMDRVLELKKLNEDSFDYVFLGSTKARR